MAETLRAQLALAAHRERRLVEELRQARREQSTTLRVVKPSDPETWLEVVPEYAARARKFGEPGLPAILKGIRLLRFAEGAKGTASAAYDLAAVLIAWAERLLATEARHDGDPPPTDAAADQRRRRAA